MTQEEIEVVTANEKMETDAPQIHLSAEDFLLVDDATQVVFHKFRDGLLFVEVYTNKDVEKHIPHLSFTLSNTARIKLREYLNTPVTY